MSSALGQMEFVKEADFPMNKSGHKSGNKSLQIKSKLPKIGDKFPNDSNSNMS